MNDNRDYGDAFYLKLLYKLQAAVNITPTLATVCVCVLFYKCKLLCRLSSDINFSSLTFQLNFKVTISIILKSKVHYYKFFFVKWKYRIVEMKDKTHKRLFKEALLTIKKRTKCWEKREKNTQSLFTVYRKGSSMYQD